MSAGHQRPMIALALTGTANYTVDVTYTVASTENITVTLDGLVRYNVGGTASGTDLLAYVVSQLNAGSIHTWAGDDPVSGNATPGRTRITCTPTTGDVSSITIPSALGELLGFDTTTPTITSNVITSKYTRAGQWIPGPHNEVYVLEHAGKGVDNGVMTQGVSGPVTSDIYGRKVPHMLMCGRFLAPFAWNDYAQQAAFVAFDPALTAGDPNLSFEALCYRWARTSDLRARFYPDHTDLTNYVQVKAQSWVYDPRKVVVQTGGRAKMHHQLQCEMVETS